MAIPKLSRLADEGYQYAFDPYPVKKRGEKRRLIPNWYAVFWLEDATQTDTEIDVEDYAVDPEGEFTFERALGWYDAKRRGQYVRPMFQVFPANGGGLVSYKDPCAACQDFSRSWACPDHPELDWSTEEHTWIRPCTGADNCACAPCQYPQAALPHPLDQAIEDMRRFIISSAPMLDSWGSTRDELRRDLGPGPGPHLSFPGLFTLEVNGETLQSSAQHDSASSATATSEIEVDYDNTPTFD